MLCRGSQSQWVNELIESSIDHSHHYCSSVQQKQTQTNNCSIYRIKCDSIELVILARLIHNFYLYRTIPQLYSSIMMRFQSWSAVAVVIFSILLNADNINNCCSAFSFASTGDPVTAASLSQKAVTKASNNQFMSVGTRRDTIKMPSQTPMVPWTVRFCLFLNTLFRFYCCCFALLCIALVQNL